MKMSDSIKNIAPAFAKMQGELKDLFKGASGYNYYYATLDAVLKEIRERNQKNDLFFTQNLSVENNEIKIETAIFHSSGEYFLFETSFPFARMKGMNDYQSAGSGFTYARRYVLSAIFGVASDEDSDGAGEQEEIKRQEKVNKNNQFRKQVLHLANTDEKRKSVTKLLGLLKLDKLDQVGDKGAFLDTLNKELNKIELENAKEVNKD